MLDPIDQIIYNYISFEFEGYQRFFDSRLMYTYFTGDGGLVLFKFDEEQKTILINKTIYNNCLIMFDLGNDNVFKIFFKWFKDHFNSSRTLWCSDFDNQYIIDGQLKL